LNLPNFLTLSRFILIPIYFFVFFYFSPKVALFVLLVSGLTDILDGYFARKRGMITQLGQILDPLADKTMMISVIVSLLLSSLIPWQAAIAVFIRDLGMIIGSIVIHIRGVKLLPANHMGKFTTILFYISIIYVILEVSSLAVIYLWIVIGISYLTAILYTIQLIRLHQANQ
jgi:cardiolipin synthase